MSNPLPPGLDDALRFPLNDALQGRRARRFSLGAEIPDGMLRFCSCLRPLPLEDIEKKMVLSEVSGITGWHYMISHNPRYAPFLPNYSGSVWGVDRSIAIRPDHGGRAHWSGARPRGIPRSSGSASP